MTPPPAPPESLDRPSAAGPQPSPLAPNQNSSSAFTLTELLVVLAIIVLLLAVAVPAFHFLTGTRSTEAAENLISAALGRARGYAISHQRPAGLAFFVDPVSQRTTMALVVTKTKDPTGALQADDPYLNYDAKCLMRYYQSVGTRAYIDFVPDEDFQTLPPGVGCQLILDPRSGIDRYVGAGAILFDAEGRLLSKEIGFSANSEIGRMLQLSVDIPLPPIPPTPNLSFRSQLGLVLYDLSVFRNQGFTQTLDSVSSPGHDYRTMEANEERWLDDNANASQLLISRYSGAILRGE
jgi:prepilin-type N-terminal cleavage/methylation domain-containing protein